MTERCNGSSADSTTEQATTLHVEPRATGIGDEYTVSIDGLFRTQGRGVRDCGACPDKCRTVVLALRTYDNGQKATWMQCRTCKRGDRAVGARLVTAAIAAGCTLGDWDDSYRAQEDAASARTVAHARTRAESADAARRAAYTTYLGSEKWQGIRRKVLERDKGQCQGCLNAKATQVHHKTYEHLGDELLFELESVCDDCHEKIHPHMREAAR